MAEAHDTNKVAGVAFGFAGGAAVGTLFSRTRPEIKALIDRLKSQPQGFGQQVRAIEGFQQPALRSGFASKGAVARLTQKEINAVKPMELPYLKKGVDWEWFAENSPKIDQLRGMHPNDPKKFYLAIRREFKPQNLNELQIRRTLDYAGFNTYAIPEGVPRNVMVEFADKNGGIIYRLAGSTNKQNVVIRVCPGLAKESIPSSYINGGIKNETLRQQTPYVVQTNGAFKLRTDGTWTRNQKDPTTHLPLETYHFKGWE